MKQVNKNHYDFNNYIHLNRWCSYWYQLKEILELDPKSVLEFGVTNNITRSMLSNDNIKYYTADIDKELKPDYLIKSISNFNIDNDFDVVCAFQVLEHLPYEDFETCLIKLKQHSDKYVIISLPYFAMDLRFSLIAKPFVNLNKIIKINVDRKLIHDEHYWEIGRKDYPLKRILKDVKKHFNIKKNYIVKENPYHYFLVLENK